MEPGSIIIIGLDGATFSLIKPYVRAGKLPHIGRLMEIGTYGNLRSTIHPITQIAWTTFMTGKNAGKHGIFDFYARKPNSYDFQYTAGSGCGSVTLWKILSDHGKRVGCLNVPMTYPVEEVNGFMIAGLGAPGRHSDFVFPLALKDEILRVAGDYKLLDADKFMNDPQAYLRYQVEAIRQTEELSLYLLKKFPVDVFMVVFMATDQVQHLFWHCQDETHPMFTPEEHRRYGGVIFQIYQEIDRAIGRLLEAGGEDCTFVLMSDHGFGPTQKVVYLHKWLEEQGSFAFRQDGRFFRKRLKHLLGRFRHRAMQVLPRAWKNELRRFFPALVDKFDSYVTFGNVDWSRTQAYPWGAYGNININLQGREPQGVVAPGAEYEELRAHIARKLLELKDPDTARPVVEQVYRREELYHGDFVHLAPDLIVVFQDYAYYTAPSRNLDPGKKTFEKAFSQDIDKPLRALTQHRIDGICLFAGPGVKPRQEITGAHIADVAPTLLHLLDLAVPVDMDGRVLMDILAEDRRSRPVRYADVSGRKDISPDSPFSDEEQEAIAGRLRALGYLE
ncbi:MAG: hypothetical protein FJ128_08975 [Deltaproteobacteria bacterium]|nr:hypothetical protein [Deltaproteobacteria bacterium]MBM4287003.1 hypothetical protein [Deltaproteobacteria bacterium]